MSSPSSSMTMGKSSFTDAATRKFVRLILYYTFLPLASIAWVSTESWLMVALSVAFMPCFVILQGAFSLLTYRLFYADSPIPLTPRHGVVVVNPRDKPQIPCVPVDQESLEEDERLVYASTRCGAPEDDDAYDIKYETNILNQREFKLLERAANQRPLRLLVIGDSLAIGVGQNHWPTPVMPETIAKTISKKMGGRAVYWTCHGATGASIGWVIRELERGVEYLNKDKNSTNAVLNNTASLSDLDGDESTCSDTDESTTDESSDGSTQRGSRRTGIVEGDKTCNISEWKTRLKQHRERFEPDLQGFYDIAVVLTGPNDLKTAVLPFLITGEDGEFRRQAQERGGGFGGDLHLLLETLTRKMKIRIQHLRHSVEAAKESVIGQVEATIERIAPGISKRSTKHSLDTSDTESIEDGKENVCFHHGECNKHVHDHEHENCRPLVVLPGMPARALPIFQHEPVRFYAPSVVDIMDAHKKDVAAKLPNDILFVQPPTKDEIAHYVKGSGPSYEQRESEETLLSLRDIQRHDCVWQEQRMHAYYDAKGKSAFMNNPFKKIRNQFLGRPPPVHLKAFAVDGIHPNELGYDFWGRYIATAICEEWQKREERAANTSKEL